MDPLMVASTEVWFSMGAVFGSVTEDSEAMMSISKRNENKKRREDVLRSFMGKALLFFTSSVSLEIADTKQASTYIKSIYVIMINY